jgi:hypothetical protein
VSCSSCFCVLICLASKAERACSKAVIQSLLMVETGSSQKLKAQGKSEGGSLAGKYMECAESESDDGLWKTPMMSFGTAEDWSSW